MNSKRRSAILCIGDFILFHLAVVITVVLIRPSFDPDFLARHLEVFPFIFCIWIAIFYSEGLYSLRTTMLGSMALSLTRAHTLSVVSSFVIFYFMPSSDITPRRNLIIIGILSFFFTYGWHKLLRKLISSNRFKIKTSLLGEIEAVKLISQDIQDRPYLGFEIIGRTQDIKELPLDQSDLVVVDREQLKTPHITDQLLDLLRQDKAIMELTQFSEVVSGKVPVSAIDSAWFLEVCGKPTSTIDRWSKDLIDRLISLILFLIMCAIYLFLLPLLLILSGRPLFFSQTRTGFLGKTFKIYKLRTMVVNAEQAGAQWSTPGDARITPIGKFLRKTRLDELPQLWNILKGDMSLVGPRPERPEFIETVLAPKIPFYNQRHLVKPGVTGWAQVNYRYGYSSDDAWEKLQYDLYYVKNQNFWLDFRIILKTFKTVLTGAGQ
jgi:exopolysaccharide biosynthesis polyprenyl glycosylphosphotransferase